LVALWRAEAKIIEMKLVRSKSEKIAATFPAFHLLLIVFFFIICFVCVSVCCFGVALLDDAF